MFIFIMFVVWTIYLFIGSLIAHDAFEVDTIFEYVFVMVLWLPIMLFAGIVGGVQWFFE